MTVRFNTFKAIALHTTTISTTTNRTLRIVLHEHISEAIVPVSARRITLACKSRKELVSFCWL